MNNEKDKKNKELIKEVAKEISNNIGLDMYNSTKIAEIIVNRYTVKKKKAFTVSYTTHKTIYVDDYEEAKEIYEKMSLEDVGYEGEWSLTEN